jgi:hypothetical protein
MVEWLRLPGDVVFIFVGALPLVLALLVSYRGLRQRTVATQARIAAAGRVAGSVKVS